MRNTPLSMLCYMLSSRTHSFCFLLLLLLLLLLVDADLPPLVLRARLVAFIFSTLPSISRFFVARLPFDSLYANTHMQRTSTEGIES